MARPRSEPPDLTRMAIILEEIGAIRESLDRLEFEVAGMARDNGATWDAIGEAHDPPIARQTAQKKYSHPKPRRRKPER